MNTLNQPTEISTTDTTLTSLIIVDLINLHRGPSEAQLRHDSFMSKAKRILGEDSSLFLRSSTYTVNNAQRTRDILVLPRQEAYLVLHSYGASIMNSVVEMGFESVNRVTQCNTPQTDKQVKHRPIPGFVYVLESSDGSCVKIGRSKNPDKRIRTLRSVSNATGRCFVSCVQEDSPLLERTCHEAFTANRMNGEWFRLGFDEAVLFVKANTKAATDDCISLYEREKESRYTDLANALLGEPKPTLTLGNNVSTRDAPDFVNMSVDERKEAYLSVCRDTLSLSIELIERKAAFKINALKMDFYLNILVPTGMAPVVELQS